MDKQFKIEQHKNGMSVESILELAHALENTGFKIDSKKSILGEILQDNVFNNYEFISSFSDFQIESATDLFVDLLYEEETKLEELEENYDKKEKKRIKEAIKKYKKITRKLR